MESLDNKHLRRLMAEYEPIGAPMVRTTAIPSKEILALTGRSNDGSRCEIRTDRTRGFHLVMLRGVALATFTGCSEKAAVALAGPLMEVVDGMVRLGTANEVMRHALDAALDVLDNGGSALVDRMKAAGTAYDAMDGLVGPPLPGVSVKLSNPAIEAARTVIDDKRMLAVRLLSYRDRDSVPWTTERDPSIGWIRGVGWMPHEQFRAVVRTFRGPADHEIETAMALDDEDRLDRLVGGDRQMALALQEARKVLEATVGQGRRTTRVLEAMIPVLERFRASATNEPDVRRGTVFGLDGLGDDHDAPGFTRSP
jgi:hypothetical protein